MGKRYFRGFLAALALLFSNECLAAWKDYGQTDTGTFYYDPSTVKKKGKIATVWVLYDLIEAKRYSNTNDFYLSNINLTTIDCAAETLKEDELNYYTDHMGKGSLIDSGLSASAFQITPETIADGLKGILCK